MDGYKNLQKWTSIRTANIVSLHTVFTIKAFGDQSIMFVYDFHPAAETLMQRHFMQGFYNKKRHMKTETKVLRSFQICHNMGSELKERTQGDMAQDMN